VTVQTAPASSTLTRRQRIGAKVVSALRGGLAGALVATVAWLAAGLLVGSAFVFLIIATFGVGVYVAVRGDVPTWVWFALGVAWGVVFLERAVVQEHGGVWVAIASYIGVVVGARRAGISKWAYPLLLYPLISVAIVWFAGEDMLEPWGVSWLWVAAVLGPVIGARTLLSPRPSQKALPASPGRG
jgi:hypothetical protein